MLGIGPGTRVMVATRPVDFRKGPDALAALVGAEYGGDPYSGVIYVFRAKRSNLPTFDIRFAPRYDPVSVASIFRD